MIDVLVDDRVCVALLGVADEPMDLVLGRQLYFSADKIDLNGVEKPVVQLCFEHKDYSLLIWKYKLGLTFQFHSIFLAHLDFLTHPFCI